MARIKIQSDHDLAIREHARRAFPHECCGFLLGQDRDDVREIVKVLAAVNNRGEEEMHNRFTIGPDAFMRADKVARSENLEILGFYHSHPDAPARPSQYDLDHAWPVYSYVIVSVPGGEPAKMTSWVLRDDRAGFDEQDQVTGDTPS